MTDSENKRIQQLEAALAECQRERDEAIQQKQYASGFLGVEAIERDALRAEIARLKTQVAKWKDRYTNNMNEVIEYCLNEDPPLTDVADLIEELMW